MKRTCILLLAMAGLLPGREVTGRNGEKIAAETVSRTEPQVELKLKDGKNVKVALDSLSSGDPHFVKTWEDPAAKTERLKGGDPGEVLAAKGYFELTTKEVPAQGQAGGDAVIGTVQPKTFGDGSGSCAPPECYVLTLEHFPKNVLERIDGMVGGQFFVDHAALLDYSAKKLWLKE